MSALAQLLGESPGMVDVRENVARLLKNSAEGRRLAPILIQGETGTGKTVLARAMHDASARRQGPFVDLNAGAVAETLLEDQLFGHERGAFTDAREARGGFFQEAHRGTLFLDEVGLMSPALQGKLLKVIEERTVRRLGARRTEPVDVWVITASNADLAQAMRDGSFRADLYYRLAGVTLWLPPLRERGGDILLLAEHFLESACRVHEILPRGLDAGARGVLLAHDWPGNVRELARVMECVAVFADGPVITEGLLRTQMGDVRPARRTAPDRARPPLKAERDALERERLLEALRDTGHNLSQAADRLGMKRNTFRYRLERLGLLDRLKAPSGRAAATAAATAETSAPTSTRWEPRRLALLRIEAVPFATTEALPLARVVDAAVEKVGIFGGRVEERGPTGLVAAFGLEIVEDAPRRAAHTAMAVQKAVERARAEGGGVAVRLAIEVRRLPVGVGAGTATIDADARREAWAHLDTLLARAEPGAAVVSDAAAPFLERRFELAPLDAAEIGKPRARRLVGHASAGVAPRRPMTAFVGRRPDVEVLQHRLAAALGGQGKLIGIVGDAGIGKSRLLVEFCRDLPRQVLRLEGACFSYASAIPYVPVLGIMRQICGITEADTAETIGASLRRRLETLGLDVAESAPYLDQLFGLREGAQRLADLTPDAIRLRTLQTLRQVIVGVSRRQPVVLIVEDLHWADKPSQDVVTALVDDLPGVAMMVLGTYRPGFRPPWIDRPLATQIALSPLSSEESLAVVRSVLATDVPDAVTRLILSKAEGNPFFLEEICRAFQGHGSPGTVSTVPDTIEEVLVARIEGLPSALREILQSAAVLGREFAPRLLRAIVPETDALDGQLAALTALEFLYRTREGLETIYVFKHALTQEVAYGSLAPERRRALHSAAGHAIEQLFAERLEEVYDRLAYHYARTEEAAKAVSYLSRLARRAARADAHETAVQAWREALQHVERLPPDTRSRRRMELLLALPDSLLPLGRVGEASALLLQERECLEQLHDSSLAARYYFLLARAFMLRNHALVMENAGRSIAEAERCGDDATSGAAYGVLAIACALSGAAQRGIECGRRAVALLEKTKDLWYLSYSYWALGLCCSEIGAFQEALGAERRALEIGREIGSLPLESSALWVIGIIHSVMGEWDLGIAECREAVAKSGDVLYRAINSGFLGFAYVEAGDSAAAIAVLEEVIPPLRQFGLNAHAAWFTSFLAEAYRLDGRLERAEILAEDARRVATETRFDVAVGWSQQSLGRTAAARGDVATARARFAEALASFSATQSRYETARTYLDLAVMSMRCGEREAACRHLGAADAVFEELDVPRYRARVAALAAEWGVGPTENR